MKQPLTNDYRETVRKRVTLHATRRFSLSQDKYHTTTTPEFFTRPGTMCKVYEDGQGPVLFVRGSSVLRLDIQFVSNEDGRRNIKVMQEGLPPLAQKARENGYTEIVFNTTSPLLKAFCTKRFGFTEVEGDELRLML